MNKCGFCTHSMPMGGIIICQLEDCTQAVREYKCKEALNKMTEFMSVQIKEDNNNAG